MSGNNTQSNDSAPVGRPAIYTEPMEQVTIRLPESWRPYVGSGRQRSTTIRTAIESPTEGESTGKLTKPYFRTTIRLPKSLIEKCSVVGDGDFQTGLRTIIGNTLVPLDDKPDAVLFEPTQSPILDV